MARSMANLDVLMEQMGVVTSQTASDWGLKPDSTALVPAHHVSNLTHTEHCGRKLVHVTSLSPSDITWVTVNSKLFVAKRESSTFETAMSRTWRLSIWFCHHPITTLHRHKPGNVARGRCMSRRYQYSARVKLASSMVSSWLCWGHHISLQLCLI